MTLNLSGLQQKFDNTLETIDNFVEYVRKLGGQKGYAQFEYWTKDGQLKKSNTPTIPQLIEQFRQGVNAQMAKTVYVHQQEGSDTTGDGSQNAPFKSFPKAIFSAPSGGEVKVVLLSDYELANDSGVTFIVNRCVRINTNGHVLRKTNTRNRFVLFAGISYLAFESGANIEINTSGLSALKHEKALIHIEANGVGFVDIGWDDTPENMCTIKMDSHFAVATRSIGFLNVKGTSFTPLNDATGLYVLGVVGGGHVEGYGTGLVGVDGTTIALTGRLNSY